MQKYVLWSLPIICLIGLIGCQNVEELTPQEPQKSPSEISLIEQELGVNLAKTQLFLNTQDGKASATLTVAAISEEKLAQFLLDNKITLHAISDQPKLNSDPNSTAQSTPGRVDYTKGVIIEIDETYRDEQVEGISLAFEPVEMAMKDKPGDLTENYNEQVFLINNDATGFTITQAPNGGAPPGTLGIIGVEFWYKQGFLQFSWKFSSFGTVAPGATRSDSESGARKIQVVVGYQTQSALFVCNFF